MAEQDPQRPVGSLRTGRHNRGGLNRPGTGVGGIRCRLGSTAYRHEHLIVVSRTFVQAESLVERLTGHVPGLPEYLHLLEVPAQQVRECLQLQHLYVKPILVLWKPVDSLVRRTHHKGSTGLEQAFHLCQQGVVLLHVLYCLEADSCVEILVAQADGPQIRYDAPCRGVAEGGCRVSLGICRYVQADHKRRLTCQHLGSVPRARSDVDHAFPAAQGPDECIALGVVQEDVRTSVTRGYPVLPHTCRGAAAVPQIDIHRQRCHALPLNILHRIRYCACQYVPNRLRYLIQIGRPRDGQFLGRRHSHPEPLPDHLTLRLGIVQRDIAQPPIPHTVQLQSGHGDVSQVCDIQEAPHVLSIIGKKICRIDRCVRRGSVWLSCLRWPGRRWPRASTIQAGIQSFVPVAGKPVQ